MAYKAPEAKSPDSYALDVLAMILGTGRTSRLYQNLVEKQIATEADANSPACRTRSSLPSMARTSGSHRGRAGSSPAGRGGADQGRAGLRRGAGAGQEPDPGGLRLPERQRFRAGEPDRLLGYGRRLALLATYLERVNALTPADIQRVAMK